MNYNSLFNLLYSTEISEATKTEIVEKINYPIQESANAEPLVETYLELLDTLVYSTASEALIYNIIDETFSQLSEEVINEVSDEWVKRKVQDSMAARKGAADAANRSVKGGVVGLSQLRRQDQAQSNLEKGQAKAASIQARLDKRTPAAEPKAESGAMNKLKSTVGKVKSFVSKADKGPDYVGLSRAIGRKANQDNIGAETLRQQTTYKEEKPAEVKAENKEVKPAKSKEQKPAEVKAEKKTTSPEETLKKAKEIGDRIHKQVQSDIKKMDKDQAKRDKEAQKEVEKRQKNFEKLTAKKEKAKKEEPAQQKLDLETPEKEEKKPAEIKAKTTEEKPKKRTGKITINAKGRNKKTTEEKPAEVKAETPEVEETPKAKEASKEEPKIKVDTKAQKSEYEKYLAKVKRETAARNADKERLLQTYKSRRKEMTAKPGYDENAVKDLDNSIANLEKELGKAKVNEAISDLVVTLLGTNISESCFVEVMEMVAASKTNAERALKRDEEDAMAVIDDIHKDVEVGKGVDPTKVERAEEKRQKYEHYKKIFDKKFNNNP